MKQGKTLEHLNKEKIFFTIVKVFLTFFESMTSYVTPIFSDNIKNLKSCVQDGTDIFATQKEYYSVNPISIR